jgi:hypothetical protein
VAVHESLTHGWSNPAQHPVVILIIHVGFEKLESLNEKDAEQFSIIQL